MNEQSGRVVVAGGGIRVDLKRGDNPAACTVIVKYLERTDGVDLMRVARVPGDEAATQASAMELGMRMTITGAENLTHHRSGESVEFKSGRVPGLDRALASRAVLNALSDEDMMAVLKAVGGHAGLSESQAGN